MYIAEVFIQLFAWILYYELAFKKSKYCVWWKTEELHKYLES